MLLYCLRIALMQEFESKQHLREVCTLHAKLALVLCMCIVYQQLCCLSCAAPRDPRMCPGCLGFALGEAPDLGNMVLSVSTVEEGEGDTLRAMYPF